MKKLCVLLVVLCMGVTLVCVQSAHAATIGNSQSLDAPLCSMMSPCDLTSFRETCPHNETWTQMVQSPANVAAQWTDGQTSAVCGDTISAAFNNGMLVPGAYILQTDPTNSLYGESEYQVVSIDPIAQTIVVVYA